MKYIALFLCLLFCLLFCLPAMAATQPANCLGTGADTYSTATNSWSCVAAGSSLAVTASNLTYYPTLSATTSSAGLSTLYTSALNYNASTGLLTAPSLSLTTSALGIPSGGTGNAGTLSAAPNTISGILAWYSASTLTCTTAGTAVASVADSAGLNGPMVQATGGNKPTCYPYAANGSNGLVMNGTSSVMTFTPVTTVGTAIVVFSEVDPQAGNYGPVLGNNGCSGACVDLAAPVSTSPWLIDPAQVPTTKYASPVRLNGINVGSLAQVVKPKGLTIMAVNYPSAFQANFQNIGQAQNVSNRFFGGVIAEVALFNRDLTTAETAEVENYFADPSRYNITLGTKPSYGGRANAVFIGDSITAGQGATSFSTFMATDLGTLRLPVTNLGVSGSCAAPFTSCTWGWSVGMGRYLYNFNWVRTNQAMNQVAHIFLGTNDLFYSQTPAATYAALQISWAQARALGFKVVAYTILSRSNTGTPGGFNVARNTLNNLIRSDPTQYDYLVDLAANSVIGYDGAETNTTYFQSDLVHPTNAGQQIIANLSEAAYAQFGF